MNTAKMTKPHPIPVLLLFAAATAVLVWLLFSGVEDEPPRRAARWAETISDLDACCRRKHVRSEQYDHFAAIAAGERREAAARLFRAMALSARVQEAECAAAIGRLGGRYTPPVKVALFRGATDENLARSLAYERQRLRTAPDIGIARALARGNRLIKNYFANCIHKKSKSYTLSPFYALLLHPRTLTILCDTIFLTASLAFPR